MSMMKERDDIRTPGKRHCQGVQRESLPIEMIGHEVGWLWLQNEALD